MKDKRLGKGVRYSKKGFLQGEGVAVFKLIGYFKTYKDANEFTNKTMRKTIGKDKYQIYKKERMMLWGTEYDK